MSLNLVWRRVNRYRLEFLCLAVVAILFFSGRSALAAPYNGQPFTYQQPDGEEITVYVWGDEFLAHGETQDGYLVTKDPKTGYFCYAKLKPDGSEMISTGVRVGRTKPPGLQPKLRYPRAVADTKHKQRREKLGFDDRGRMLPYEDLKEELVQRAASEADGDTVGGDTPIVLAPPSAPTVQKRISLVLLASFPDRPGDITKTQAEVDDFCNAEGYTTGGNAASVRGYFLKQSNNRFDYSSIVTAWFTAANPRDYYTTDQGVSFGTQARELITEGLQALKDDGFDFTLCDGDGDGDLDGVNIFYAGSVVNAWADDFGLWPHSSSGTWAPLSGSGLTSSSCKYQITALGAGLVIGTWCHENGHMICNFPDLYSYNGNAADFGNYSLMSGGNYGDGQRHPTSIDSYLKMHAGWMDIVDLDSSSQQRCVVQVDGNRIYRYKNPAVPKEYFTFEIRDNTGYEGPYGGSSVSVNPGTGLVVYHNKEDGSSTASTIFTTSNPNCDYTKPYEAMIVEANPTAAKTPWYDDPTPDTSDAFRSSGKSYLSDTTHPDLKFWLALPTSSGGGRNTASGCVITNISADGAVMTFVIGSGALSGTASVGLSRSTMKTMCDYGSAAESQTFAICNAQGGTLNYNVSDNVAWLSCNVASGSATTEADLVTVSFQTAALLPGTYNGTITVDDGGAGTKTISVDLTVASEPILAVSTNSLSANGISGSAGPEFTIGLSNPGGGSYAYTLSKTAPWLTLSRTVGTVLDEVDLVTVSLDATTLVPGTYNDTITVTATNAAGSPKTITVTFDVNGDDIIVTTPNGGETFITGVQANITWLSGIGGNVSIHLLKNGSLDSVIISSTANDGSYTWNVPEFKLGSAFRVRVTSLDSNPGFNDDSNADFAIQRPPLLLQDFEASTSLPAGWSQTRISGTVDWKVQKGGSTAGGGNPSTAHSGTNNATLVDSDSADDQARLVTPVFNAVSYTNVTLKFWHTQVYWPTDQDHLNVFYSTNGGSAWVSIAVYTNDVSAWTERTLSLPSVSTNTRVAFEGNARYGYGVCIDDVMVTGEESGAAGVIVTKSGGSVDVTEDGVTDTYTVVLGAAPTHDVFITITPDIQVTVDTNDLTFTTGNWDSPQTVTVAADDDRDHELDHIGIITHAVSSADPAFDGITIDDVLVSITDNDNNAPEVNAGPDETVLLIAGNPGLYYGEVPGDIDVVTPNPETAIITDVATKTGSGTIPANTTRIFTGKIFDADGQISFTEHIDDKTRIWIDGVIVLSDDNWQARASTANLNLTPGWHDIEIRISNGTGGSGQQSFPGIGFDPNGGTSWQTITDPGDGSLLTAGLAPVDVDLNGVVSDPDGDPVTALWSVSTGLAVVSFNDNSLTNATVSFSMEGVYTLQLTASDSVLQENDSVIITVTTNPLPPAILAPTGLGATAVASNRIDLAWTDNSTNETGFAIERSTTSGSGFALIGTAAADVEAYSDIGLAIGETYYYRVYATNSTDSSAMTGVVSATTPKAPATVTLGDLTQTYDGTARLVSATTVPAGLTVVLTYGGSSAAPTNAASYAVVATINDPGYEGSTNGTLVVNQATPTVSTWPTASSIVEGQAVSNATLSGGTGSVPGIFSFNNPTFVPALGVYTADVTFAANDSVNQANVSGTAEITVTEAPPLAPVGLSAIMRVGQVDLSWTASINATSYNVKRASLPGGTYTTVGTPVGTSFIDMTVTNGSPYYYVVSAVNSGGEGPDSAEVDAVLLQALPFTETFDGAGMASMPGTLNGQRGWTGGSSTLVQAGAARGGTNGLSIAEDVAAIDFMNGTNTVALSFWIKAVAGAEPKPADLPTNATAVIWVGTNQNIMAYSNTTVVTLPLQVAADQWCHFEASVDYAGGVWSLAVNGTNAATGLGLYSAQAGFAGLEIQNTSATATYLDDISISSALAMLTAYENWLIDYYGTTSVDGNSMSSNGVNTVLEAYIIGLDPTDPDGLFAVSGIGDHAGAAVLNWNSVSGRLYNVYWSSNLLGGASGFQLLYSNIPWNASTVTDTVHSAEDKGFYRIDVQLE